MRACSGPCASSPVIALRQRRSCRTPSSDSGNDGIHVSEVDDPSAYLFRTAMNVFRNRYRRATLALRKTISLAPTEDALATVEARDVVVRALRGLTPDQRAAVVLTGYVGLTSEEAGKMLGMRASTVRTVATRARAAIRDKAGDPR